MSFMIIYGKSIGWLHSFPFYPPNLCRIDKDGFCPLCKGGRRFGGGIFGCLVYIKHLKIPPSEAADPLYKGGKSYRSLCFYGHPFASGANPIDLFASAATPLLRGQILSISLLLRPPPFLRYQKKFVLGTHA